jgi:hypothetical protein
LLILRAEEYLILRQEEITETWRNFQNDEFYIWNIFVVISFKMLKCTVHAAVLKKIQHAQIILKLNREKII